MKTTDSRWLRRGLWLAVCALAFLSAELAAPATQISAQVGPFIVDRTAPTAPVRVAPADGTVFGTGTVSLKVTSSDVTTQVAGYCFKIGDESVAWQPGSIYTLTGLADGAYAWQCRSRDVAGNESAWSPWFTFTMKTGAAGEGGVPGDGGSGGGSGSGDGLTDSDGDGLPDAWEFAFFRSLDYTSGGPQDSDEDGICDVDEYKAATHPFEFRLHLRAGWNLLSFPFDLGRDSIIHLQNATGISFWCWAGVAYQRVAAVRAYQGIMVYSKADVPLLAVSGFPPLNNRVTLDAGWNLIGSGYTAALPDLTKIAGIWQLGSRGQYVLLNPAALNVHLEALTAYWVYGSGGEIAFVRQPAP